MWLPRAEAAGGGASIPNAPSKDASTSINRRDNGHFPPPLFPSRSPDCEPRSSIFTNCRIASPIEGCILNQQPDIRHGQQGESCGLPCSFHCVTGLSPSPPPRLLLPPSLPFFHPLCKLAKGVELESPSPTHQFANLDEPTHTAESKPPSKNASTSTTPVCDVRPRPSPPSQQHSYPQPRHSPVCEPR
jgi:hypothetical protein